MFNDTITFWGKLKKENETGKVVAHLPLVNHCIDVACVFRELVALPAIRRSLDRAAGRALDSVCFDRLAVLCLLHDLGKCNWGFQNKRYPDEVDTAGHVRQTAPLFFDDQLAEKAYQVLDCERMATWFDRPESLYHLFVAVISHHGKPAFDYNVHDAFDFRSLAKYWEPKNGLNPLSGLKKLTEACQVAFPEAYGPKGKVIAVTTALEHLVSGLVMLSDWLGSHTGFFPFRNEGSRQSWARGKAQAALAAVGLNVDSPRSRIVSKSLSAKEIIGFEPYPLQNWFSSEHLPSLIVAESDTGSGKTEAALIHFLRLFAAGEVDSLYFALPTRVAARELYGRVYEITKKVLGQDAPPVLLAVPGYVQIDGDPDNLLPSENHLWIEADQLRRERSWSAERPKRYLAAPVAVGTIDQALLSTLQTPHAHLRQACLNRSLIVIDEVHSSDVYMRALTRRMLLRHLEAGGKSLLLSATLGCEAKNEFLYPEKSVNPEPFEQAVHLPYPAVSSPGSPAKAFPSSGRPKTVRIQSEKLLESPESILPLLEKAIQDGSRILVIVNTVARAIGLFRAAECSGLLVEALFSCNQVHCPHHGRFAQPDRELLDRTVSSRLGKNSPVGPVILFGTQTLEQSLDIDADLLVTDLCPMDVLLQRIGRLHRHDRGPRPDPVCVVLLPDAKDFSEYIRPTGEATYGVPAGLGHIYEDLRILQLTHDFVSESSIFKLPQDNRMLVESATHPEFLSKLEGPQWDSHRQHLEGIGGAQLMAAHAALIPDAHFGEFVFPSGLEQRLVTRLGLDNRRLLLNGSYESPFGQKISEVDIPGHMARGLDTDQAETVMIQDGNLLIGAGDLYYRYSRLGLEKCDEPA